MALQGFAVLQCGEVWQLIDHDGQRRDFQSEDEALAKAEALARLARWRGEEVNVFIHRENELRRLHSFDAGQDEA